MNNENFMSKIYLFIIATLALSKVAFAQTTFTWIGGTIGDFQVSTNWSPNRTVPVTTDILAFNATTAITISNIPNQTIGAIRILSGTNAVTFKTNLSTNILSLNAVTPLIYTTAGSVLVGDFLTIALTNTAAFTISSGTFGIASSSGGRVTINSALTVAGGTLDFDVSGTGGAVINANASIKYLSGSFNSSTAAAITWTNSSNYFHAADGSFASAIPVSTWNTGSTCNITGMNSGTIAPTGFGTPVFFSNLIWNCPLQSGNVDLNIIGVTVNINGTLTITNTNNQSIFFSGTGSVVFNVGSYVQNSGTVMLQTNSGSTTLSVAGGFTQNAGVLDFVGGGASSGIGLLDLKGSVSKNAGSTWQSSSTNTTAQMFVQFSGSASQVVNIAGTWSDPAAGRCHITNNNSDAIGVSLTGTLKVVNSNSGSPATCNVSGQFSGTGVVTYTGAGAGVGNFTLTYNSSVTQLASTVEFPATNGPTNLTINNLVAVNFPAFFNRTITGALNMVKGNLSIGSGNTLTLSNTSLATQLNYTAGFITSGTLSRRFPTSGLPTNALTSNSLFPFGSGANNRSINVFFSATNLTGGTAGNIAISHTAAINTTAISVVDNSITLNKRTNSNWQIGTGTFALGSGGQTISITALGTNIGSVDDISTLRLTNASTGFGTLIASTGSTDAPLVGKSGLVIADINAATIYLGSDNTNTLIIVTFTWNGSSNTNWTNALNWTGGVGYPSSPTEIAIVNTVAGNMPSINNAEAINVFQLTVGAAASLTMTGTGSINVADDINFTGTANFASTSTFIYSSSGITQNIVELIYGNLTLAGSVPKILPATTTVTGNYLITGASPTLGTGNFVYAGSGTQRITGPADYYNLTVTGNRGGSLISLGNTVSNNVINVANNFVVTATNYTGNGVYNTMNLNSTGTVNIPGFIYGTLNNPGNGLRVFDPLGSTDPTHVINVIAMGQSSPLSNSTVTNSKVKFNRTSGVPFNGFQFFDLEYSGDMGGGTLGFSNNATISVYGTFTVSATNFKMGTGVYTFNFNGTGNQTIPSFKTINASNTEAFRFNNIWIQNNNRQVTLAGTDTIFISGALSITSSASPSTKFITMGSTVNFNTGSSVIPVLTPVSGTNNYNNIVINGGSRNLSANLIVGGNVSVISSNASATFIIGNDANNRTLTILGNLLVDGTSGYNSIVDFNTVLKTVAINLAGNLTLNGTGLITTGVGSTIPSSGTILFNGTNQNYSNTSIFKNGFVNFIVGNGTTATTLNLLNKLELIRSGISPFSSTLTIANNAILNAATNNIVVGTDDSNVGNNASFNLNAGATLITSNTGATGNTVIEGTATDGTNGIIESSPRITKTYSTAANYVLNAASTNPFPGSISTMANLTIGANVSLNKAIVATGIVDLSTNVLTQANNNLQFSGLTGTGSIAADKSSSLTISGSVGTVDTIRFASGFTTTGQFTINRAITVKLGTNLLIDKTPLTGNLITGTATSILDINGNTLTINGTVSGPGTLSGSNTSNLTLGGAAGTLNFTTGKTVLKNLSLVNNATASLGTQLDITAGTSAGNEGTVAVTGTAVLTTNGNLTLKSNAVGTSRVAPGASSGNYINGNVTVERYIESSAKRAWRLLAAPAYGQTIKQSWQENQAAGVNPGTGFGTIITSNSASWNANGFDYQTLGNSLLTYNPALNGWDAVVNTNTPITAAAANKAYMIFIRGDRAATPSNGPASSPALLRIKGTLFQGDLPAVPVVPAGQFAVIGNNYASAIDFTTIRDTNIDQTFTVWDPKLVGAYGLGGYVTFSASTVPAWKPVPAGGSYVANVPNTAIQSGQAFVVYSNGGNGNITLKETSKLTGSSMVFRPIGNAAVSQSISTNLYAVNGSTINLADGNTVVFNDEFSNDIDNKDAIKLNNFGDNFGILRDSKTLIVEARKTIADSDTIFFNMKKVKQQNYRLEFETQNFASGMMAFMEDKFLHTSQVVNMSGTTFYDFSVTGDAASSATDRFIIVFKNTTPLPVNFTSISAVKKNNNIAVEWKVENEININSYEIEKSVDGINFTKMGNKVANGNLTAGAATYSWLDVQATAGDNYYRIKSISNRGSFEYSSIVKVAITKPGAGFTVYPNPVTDGNINLQINNLPAGIYTVRLLNNAGQVMIEKVITHISGNVINSIKPATTLVNGTYLLEINGPENKQTVIKVLVQ